MEKSRNPFNESGQSILNEIQRYIEGLHKDVVIPSMNQVNQSMTILRKLVESLLIVVIPSMNQVNQSIYI